MVAAAVILQPDKVAVYDVGDTPPPYLRFRKLQRPFSVFQDALAVKTGRIETETVYVSMHRMSGFSVLVAYWPDSWQNSWAVEEILRWEGRFDEIRRDQYYADFVIEPQKEIEG